MQSVSIRKCLAKSVEEKCSVPNNPLLIYEILFYFQVCRAAMGWFGGGAVAIRAQPTPL